MYIVSIRMHGEITYNVHKNKYVHCMYMLEDRIEDIYFKVQYLTHISFKI